MESEGQQWRERTSILVLTPINTNGALFCKHSPSYRAQRGHGNMSCLWYTRIHTNAEINYKGLDVASAANYHLRRVSWPQLVGSHRSFFSRLPWNQPPISRQQIGWGARKHITTQIRSDNKSEIGVINSNLSRGMRDEGCSLVRELQRRLRGERRDMTEMSDVLKLPSYRVSRQRVTGGCLVVPWEQSGVQCLYSKVGWKVFPADVVHWTWPLWKTAVEVKEVTVPVEEGKAQCVQRW